jgi:hypothetical protein
MDVGKAEESTTPTSLNGPGSGQNQFDLSALLGKLIHHILMILCAISPNVVMKT